MSIKQRDRLCYKIFGEHEEDGKIERYLCIDERGHLGDCSRGQTIIDDFVPPDAETVMMTCEGYDVPVRVWTTNIADSETDPPTLTDLYWIAYIPAPYNWATLGDKTRAAALESATNYLVIFAEENPDAAGSDLRCFKCQRKLRGDYVALDASRYEGEDLIGFRRISDPFDIKKTTEFGAFVSCLTCSAKVPIANKESPS